MSDPYHRNYATTRQPNDQRYYDQVLSGYPKFNNPAWVPGAYLADGSLVEFGSNCSARVVDNYSSPTQCAVWAGVPPETASMCCPLNCSPAPVVVPPVTFTYTIDQELAMVRGDAALAPLNPQLRQ